MVFGCPWGSSFSSVSVKKGDDTRAYFIASPVCCVYASRFLLVRRQTDKPSGVVDEPMTTPLPRICKM